MSQYYTATDHFVLLPALMLALFGCAVLIFDFLLFKQRSTRKWLVVFTFAGIAFTGAALFRQHTALLESGQREIIAFGGSLVIDRFTLFFNWMFLAATAVVALFSYKVLEIERSPIGEFYGLMLLANCGMF